MAPPWSKEELEAERIKATELFRNHRLEEPLEEYLDAFDQHQGIFEELLETTVDLKDKTRLVEAATDPKFIEAFRYLAGPPISEDDLKVLADTTTLAPTRLRKDREIARRVAHIVMTGLDRRRFPWVTVADTSGSNRADRADVRLEILRAGAALENIATKLKNRPLFLQPETEKVLKAIEGTTKVVAQVLIELDRNSEAEEPDQADLPDKAESPESERPDEAERTAAVVASAAMLAMRRLEAKRRNEGGQRQEEAVKKALRDAGLAEMKTRRIPTAAQAPQPGQFCGESYLGDRKADIVVGLWDNRILAIECKVSNSATNSVKRLNDTTVSKTDYWFQAFGKNQVVPTAVLSGVYKLHNLTAAQNRGLNLFWAHDLLKLTEWIQGTKS